MYEPYIRGQDAEINHPEIFRIEVFPDERQTALAAADFISNVVLNKPDAAISYATSNTVLPIYKSIADKVAGGEVDFSQTIAFHLDEYYPCLQNEPHSFVNYLYRLVFNPLKIPEKNCFVMDGNCDDPNEEVIRYDELLSRQAIDLAILGIGPGSHIAFNEQNTPFDMRTHIAKLSRETINRDQIERGQDTPTHALTQGVANLLEAENILLVAYGEQKGSFLAPALFGEISPEYPASALRLVGEKTNIIIDKMAESKLK